MCFFRHRWYSSGGARSHRKNLLRTMMQSCFVFPEDIHFLRLSRCLFGDVCLAISAPRPIERNLGCTTTLNILEIFSLIIFTCFVVVFPLNSGKAMFLPLKAKCGKTKTIPAARSFRIIALKHLRTILLAFLPFQSLLFIFSIGGRLLHTQSNFGSPYGK